MVRKLAMGRQAKGSHGKPGGSRAPKPGARHATRSHGAIRKPAEQPRSRQASMPAPSASSWGSVFEQAMEVRRYARVAAYACTPSCGLRLYALVCVGARACAPGPHAGGSKIPHESVQSGWLRGGTEQLPRLATRSWRAHRPCQRTAQLPRLREHHPATCRWPARVPVCPHHPTGNSKTSRKQLRRSPPPGLLKCVRVCVRACVRACVQLRIHVRVCARMRTLDVYVRACMQCDP